MEIYADMVKIHYEYYKNKRKQRLTSYKKHIPSNLKEIEKYSDIDSMVFENKDNNELIVAMRGLDFLSSPRDQMIGAEIFLEDAYQQSGSDFETATKKKKGISLLPNKYGEILKKEQSKIEELKKEYPNKKIVLAGHSRGGRKAIDLGEHNQLEYHAFQPAEMNRMGTPLLSMATNLIMGTVIPTEKVYSELVKTYMNRDAFEEQSRIGRIINNLFIEGYSPIEIQDKVLTSAIQSDSYQTSARKFREKILLSEMTKRVGSVIADPKNFLREPSDFTKLIPKEAMDTQEQIELGYSISSLQKQSKRKPPTESISNIYRTANDRVSGGYEHKKLVQPKHYAYDSFDHYFLGDHSINHFISKEMFNSVKEDKPIEQPIFSPSPKSQTQKEEEITPVPYEHREADTRSLCRKYPNYSPQCKFILR